MGRYHALRVRTVVDETHDAKSLVFDVPPALVAAFAYCSGPLKYEEIEPSP